MDIIKCKKSGIIKVYKTYKDQHLMINKRSTLTWLMVLKIGKRQTEPLFFLLKWGSGKIIWSQLNRMYKQVEFNRKMSNY